MPLSRDYIVHTAERYGFSVMGFEPGPGTRADVVLKCERTEETLSIGLWPEDSETELTGLLARAAVEVRGRPASVAPSGAWLL
jgi:hypothetical protein